MIQAAIAIGSNSTRLLVCDCLDVPHVLLRGREETRLMMGIDAGGKLTAAAMVSTCQAVDRLKQQALRLGAHQVHLMATSATRDARNQQEFIQLLQDMTQLPLRIISGEEEAALAFRAVAGQGNCLALDIGGGSTELTYGEKGCIFQSVSVQMGASRLLKLQPIASVEDAQNACRIARQALEEPLHSVKKRMPESNVRMVGIGGSCTTSAAMLMGKEAHGEEVEGRIVTRTDVERLLHLLSPMTCEERAKVPGLPASRVMHMPHGLCILLSVMEQSGMNQLTVSGRTNLDGFMQRFCS